MQPAPVPAAGDPLPFVPLGTRFNRDSNDEFLLLHPDGRTAALTFGDLVTPHVLVAQFNGSAWLRRNFPGQMRLIPAREGGARAVPTGFDTLAAAQYIAGLCVQAQAVADEAAQPPGPWQRFRAWLADRAWALRLAAAR